MDWISLTAEGVDVRRDEQGVPVEWTLLRIGDNPICQEGADGNICISPEQMNAIIEYFEKKGEEIPVDAGADLLKAFPCGTPENIRGLKSVIPLPIFAVGGIDHSNRDAFLAAADGFGVGIGIFRPEMSVAELRSSARNFLA